MSEGTQARRATGGTNSTTSLLLAMACVVIIVAGLKAAAAFLIPVLVAALVAFISLPVVQWLMRRRIPSGVAIALVPVVGLIVVLAVWGIAARSIAEFADSLDLYQERFTKLMDGALSGLNDLGLDLSSEELGTMVDAPALMRLIASTSKTVLGTLSSSIVVILIALFMLAEVSGLRGKLVRAYGGSHVNLRGYDEVVRSVYSYLYVKIATSLATGILVAVLIAVLGVDFPLLWGLVAFLFNFIPNIGSILAAVPPVLLALVQHGPGTAGLVAAGMTAINMVIGNLIEPRVMGERLGLSPLVVMLSLVFWSFVWGPIGMLLSVPLTMIVKIALEHSEGGRFVAVLLGPAGPSQTDDGESP